MRCGVTRDFDCGPMRWPRVREGEDITTARLFTRKIQLPVEARR
jgi:hypothetical protein